MPATTPSSSPSAPTAQRLYVANEDAAQVSVVDVASGAIVATVKIGEEPEGVTIRPDGKVVYVTSEGDGAVFAIDTATNKVLRRIPVGHRPRSIGFLPDGSRAYVSLENDGAIAVIDAQTAQFSPAHPADRQGQHAQAAADGHHGAPRTARWSMSRAARSATSSSSIRRRTPS